MTDEPSFTGGQCQAQYVVIFSVTNAYGDIACTGGNYGFVTGEAGFGPYMGPILGFTPLVGSFCPSGAQDYVVLGKLVTGPGDIDINLGALGSSPSDGFRSTRPSASIARVERFDGQPDNCGNLQPENNPHNPDRGACTATGGFNSEVEFSTGAVIESQDLVTYQSLGVTRGLTLRYDSLSADPRPIIHFSTTGTYTSNQLYIAKLTIRRGNFRYNLPGSTGNQYGLTGGENFWAIPATNSGTIDGALQVDLSDQPSGSYQYYVRSDVQPLNPAAPQFTPLAKSSVGSFKHLNRIGSSFGNGWALAGWQELIINPDASVLLLDGDGTQLLFDRPSLLNTLYTSPAGDFSRLDRLGNGTFRRILKDGTVLHF
jgi:hypothetical protein